nr:DNA-deoxyinosine glycosylase [Priestia megaterium]
MDLKNQLTSFQPIVPKRPNVLILGSMPGGISLEKQQYYGNPRNHFWKILFTLFNEPFLERYEDKIIFCKQHGIALWDTIATCYRKGSLDAAIKEEVPNDIIGFVAKHPSIKLIACNGGKAYDILHKHFSMETIPHVIVLKLPSTSSIPGRYTKTFEGKVEAWRVILSYIND